MNVCGRQGTVHVRAETSGEPQCDRGDRRVRATTCRMCRPRTGCEVGPGRRHPPGKVTGGSLGNPCFLQTCQHGGRGGPVRRPRGAGFLGRRPAAKGLRWAVRLWWRDGRCGIWPIGCLPALRRSPAGSENTGVL